MQNPLDDFFYLTHNLAGQESVEGAIYTERFNSKDFTDPNTVIYGHNMKNGSIFAGLHQYEDKAFFDENREIVVYTPEKKLTYRIFAAYASGNEHIMQAYDFTDQSVFTRYLDGIFNIRDMKANIDSGMTVTDRDKILTLSTCVKAVSYTHLDVYKRQKEYISRKQVNVCQYSGESYCWSCPTGN